MKIELIDAAFFLIITFSTIVLLVIARFMIIDQASPKKNKDRPIESLSKKPIRPAKYEPYKSRHKEVKRSEMVIIAPKFNSVNFKN